MTLALTFKYWFKLAIAWERIKEFRKEQGLNEQQLADKVGITYIQIGRYETNKGNASADVLQKGPMPLV